MRENAKSKNETYMLIGWAISHNRAKFHSHFWHSYTLLESREHEVEILDRNQIIQQKHLRHTKLRIAHYLLSQFIHLFTVSTIG